jgi:hypothetical protein
MRPKYVSQPSFSRIDLTGLLLAAQAPGGRRRLSREGVEPTSDRLRSHHLYLAAPTRSTPPIAPNVLDGFAAISAEYSSCNRSSGGSLTRAAVLAAGVGKDDDGAEHSRRYALRRRCSSTIRLSETGTSSAGPCRLSSASPRWVWRRPGIRLTFPEKLLAALGLSFKHRNLLQGRGRGGTQPLADLAAERSDSAGRTQIAQDC